MDSTALATKGIEELMEIRAMVRDGLNMSDGEDRAMLGYLKFLACAKAGSANQVELKTMFSALPNIQILSGLYNIARQIAGE